jgi:tetratricopeptide (TPR) repeat protein
MDLEPEGLFANRYRIKRLIGKGGMAAVYDVTDETNGGSVALKRLLPEQAKRRVTALLFQREFNTLAQLSHPLIIRAFDYGVYADTPYYTMERLSGENLRQLAPLPWKEAASLVRDVASALALVHSRRLIHRDVSPRNVCRTDGGRAKLIDFGTLSPMGRAKNVMGTPPFIPPESLEDQPLDARSDLFSLGAVAYFLLTGEHAYPARRIAELGHMWRRGVRPPSARAPDVPPSLDALILSLIDLNPLARPTSAAEVFDRITAIASLPRGETAETARSYLITPTLVAREDATQRFRRRLLRAERGRGGALLIESPSGCGRSRLLANFLLEAKLRGMVALRADAEDRRGEPFGVVRALARGLRESEPTLAEEAFASAPELQSLLGRDDSSSGGAASLDPERWVSTTRALARLFVDVSKKRPMVVGVDDFDACDGPSSAAIAAMADSSSEAPLLVVATVTLECKAPHAERLRHAGSAISLRPFRPVDTKQLVSSVFGDAPHSEQIADWVHRLSEGNPRTALELTQHLVDHGLARYKEGGWSLPSSIEGLNLPQSIDQALDAKVAELGSAAKELAQALSMTSEDDPLLLAEFPMLVEAGGLTPVFGALNELVSASVLAPSGPTYAFAHHEVKEAVKRGIPTECVPELHRRIARAYESGPDNVSTLAAYHLLEAGDLPEAFRLGVAAVKDRTDYFARGNSFIRTPAGSQTIDALYDWGRRNGMPAKDLSLIARAVLQLASVGDARLARHGPTILDGLERDSGLVHWKEFEHVADPVERVQACVGEAYSRYASSPDRERLLDPGTAIQELATAAATLTGVYARNADVVATSALDELISPLRPLSPALDVVGGMVNYAAGVLRGHYTRDTRLRVIERTKDPVPGIDELSRVGVYLLGLYYLALEDALQGFATADELVRTLDGHAAYAPLAWQARMLSHYYSGEEREAELCRRRRDLAMTGRLDIDGHLETSVLYEASVYATLGDLMALKGLLPALEEQSRARPHWRPYYYLATGNCEALRGEHDKAIEQYERGLSLQGIPASHAGRVLIQIKLVRSLTAAGRAEEACGRAEAALERYAEEPLMPLYRDQLELGLAGAESISGRTAEALARARAVLERAERRGLSGVLLVDFLTEVAVIAHQAGDIPAFEGIAKRVGALSAKADSKALAARYGRLLQLGQSSKFDVSTTTPESLAASSVFTTLGADVRTELELCRGPSERATHALKLLLEHSASAEGFLFVHKGEDLCLVAAIPDDEPGEELERAVREWLSAAFDAELSTQTATRSQPRTVESSLPFEILGILAGVDGEIVLAGVAALKGTMGRARPVPSAIVSAVGEGLLRAGDATGRPGLGGPQ